MQTNYVSNDIHIDDLIIDDLARLAREACVYRGRSQSINTRLPALRRWWSLIGQCFVMLKGR